MDVVKEYRYIVETQVGLLEEGSSWETLYAAIENRQQVRAAARQEWRYT
jgi:hypothetical protein